MPATRYNARPALRHPGQFARAALRDLRASRELAWRLFLRDLKARYRASILGYIWIILPPLAVTATFLLLQKAKLMNVGELGVPYALYILAGTTFWQLFADAVQAPLRIVNQSKAMLVKINFPRESLVLAAAYETLFTFAIRFAILLACLPLFQIPIAEALAGALLTPLAAAGLLAAGLALGVLLLPLGVLFQDFAQGLPLFLSVWLIATPVAYPSRPDSGLLFSLNRYNPVTHLLEWPRSLLLPIEPTHPTYWLLISLSTLALAALAWTLFRISLPHIVARLGS